MKILVKKRLHLDFKTTKILLKSLVIGGGITMIILGIIGFGSGMINFKQLSVVLLYAFVIVFSLMITFEAVDDGKDNDD